jgi:hypothetical protein
MQGMDKKYNGLLGVSWSQLILNICLGLALGRLVVWVTCDVCKMIVRTLCVLFFAMKHFGAVNVLIF